MSDVELNQKNRVLGSFYTPIGISDLMSSWAIRSTSDYVFEPSFGGCGFIDSAKSRLRSLGSRRPEKRIAGCDIDARAFEYLSSSLGATTIGYRGRFLLKDFLATSNGEFFRNKFDVVIGNPPYVANSRLSQEQKELGRLCLKEWGISAVGKVNLWMFFLVHSFSFLEEGGRLTFVLPASALQADFSKSIIKLLEKRFSSSSAIVIKERLFKHLGVKEKCIVLLASGWSAKEKTPTPIKIHHVNGVKELTQFFDGVRNIGSASSKTSNPVKALFNRYELNSYRNVSDCSNAKVFSDYLDIKIGLVTGDKKFFVLNKDAAVLNGLDYNRYCKPIVSRGAQLIGLEFTRNQIFDQIENNEKCLLLDSSPEYFRSSSYRKYIASYPKERIESNSTFSRREPWYHVKNHEIPDFFMPYMGQHGPRLVINRAEIGCSNNIHRLFFKNPENRLYVKKLYSVLLMSTFSQLSAEIECRHYGTGVLKMEPSEVLRIQILIPEIIDRRRVGLYFGLINTALQESDIENACSLADEYLFESLKDDCYSQNISRLRSCLKKARNARI